MYVHIYIYICIYIGNMTCVSRMSDSHRFTRCSPFRFLNPLEYLSSDLLAFYFG